MLLAVAFCFKQQLTLYTIKPQIFSIIQIHGFFHYLLHKNLRRRHFFHYSDAFQYSGVRYSDASLYNWCPGSYVFQQSYLPETPPVDMRFQLSFPLPTADLSASFIPLWVDAMPLNLLSMKALNSFFSLAKMSRTGGKQVWVLTQMYFVNLFTIKDQCKKVSLLGKQTFKFASAFFN